MDIAGFIQILSLYALPAILAITLHEAAHGYAAKRLGDLTAYQEGRISLNPHKTHRSNRNFSCASGASHRKRWKDGVWLGKTSSSEFFPIA